MYSFILHIMRKKHNLKLCSVSLSNTSFTYTQENFTFSLSCIFNNVKLSTTLWQSCSQIIQHDINICLYRRTILESPNTNLYGSLFGYYWSSPILILSYSYSPSLPSTPNDCVLLGWDLVCLGQFMLLLQLQVKIYHMLPIPFLFKLALPNHCLYIYMAFFPFFLYFTLKW